ncbi:flagellar assembly protein FliW [Evansella halocellulosilytica]|uniref:flagellar assembly protein FliW n=1 Tax=Evansella halocellulosilytica TaxID=2011013 RepID=UPI000BB78129|nr:flagellar assembly protein FliW [Evansella halocellulosilytica]
MKIETKYAGEMEVNEKNIITFQQGIPSFEDEKEFILLPFSEEPSPFYILQSVQTAGLAFVVMTPFSFFPDYELKLSDSTVEHLEIEQEEEVATFVVLTLKETLEESTANLRGPIIINGSKQKGKQIVLNESDYHTKHPLVTVAVSGQKGDE